MANQRKVQAEIDKLLKKVQEGTEVYDEVYEKVNSAATQLQKEKFEADLKKEIKKLQRLREQVKALIASPEVKDKKALETTRRNIEIKMENFKICERETKTKAFSKEGLATTGKLDPALAAKMHTAGWLRDSISELEERIEQLEFDIENDGGGKKGKKGQVDERETRVIRSKTHVLRLEQLLRLVENGDLEPADVDEIEGEVDAYVEGCKEESYEEENPDIYDQFDLPDVSVANWATRGESSDSSDDSDDDSGAAAAAPSKREATPSTPATPSAPPKEEGGRVIEHKKPEPKKAETVAAAVAAAPAAAAAPAKAPVKQPAVAVAAAAAPAPQAAAKAKEPTPQPAAKTPAASPVATPTSPQQVKPTAAAVLAGKASLGPAATAPATAPPAKLPLAAVLKASAATAAQPPAATAAKPSPSSGVTAPAPGSFSQGGSALMGDGLDDDADELNDDTFGGDVPVDGPMVDLASMTQQRGDWGPTSSSRAASGPLGSREPSSVPGPSAPAPSPWSRQPSTSMMSPAPTPTTPAAPPSTPAATASAPAAATPAQPAATQVAPAPPVAAAVSTEVATRANIVRMLDMSLKNLPHTSDCERLKPYAPPNPCKTPSYYPQVTHPAFSAPETFTKFSPDILFFIFYYQQTTYQQYLAAKELKRLAWRFHKKFSTWFQRHDKPKSSNDEQETGTYLYFDFERAWQTQIKNDFVFKYSFLEDELQ